MEMIYADTVIGINFNNGVVKLMLANQDLTKNIEDEEGEPEEIQMKTSNAISMPLPGFLYMVSVIETLLKDPKMTDTIKKYTEAGILQKPPATPKKRAKASA